MSLNYLVDENLPRAWRGQLLRLEPTSVVQRIGQPGSPPRGTPDPAILTWCEENEFVLVTNNRHSMPGHLRDHVASGRHVPGILVIRAGWSVGRILRELVLMAEASLENEYQDRLINLPESQG